MDLGTIIGLAFGYFMIGLAILLGGGFVGLIYFVDILSVFITIGGTIAATLVSFPLKKILKLPQVFKFILTNPTTNPADSIITLVSFSEKARREGLLALEDDLTEVSNEFLRKGIQLVVDGTDPELVRTIMENDLKNIRSRHDGYIKMFEDMAIFSPSFGMIGTLIGLVQMLKNLSDKASIGQGMATALLTTLYGSVLANTIFIPAKNKLTERNEDEMLEKQIMIEGTLSIQSGDNPRVVKDKLVAFLNPTDREAVSDEAEVR